MRSIQKQQSPGEVRGFVFVDNDAIFASDANMPYIFRRSRGVRLAVCCAFAYCAVILASRPFAEIGIEDDWSYVRSAQVLAQSGHIVYNGWATAMLGPQLYAGALAFKMFGFSFTAARASVLLIGMVTTVVLQRVLLRFGLNQYNASAVTLLTMLSPLVQPLSFTFHTDIPGLLMILSALYCCQRAVISRSSHRVILWLIAATLFGLTGGTIRQIAWLSALVMVPSAAWLQRRLRGVALAAAVLWGLSIFSVIAILHWFNEQLYSVPEKIIGGSLRLGARHFPFGASTLLLGFPLFLFPILFALALRFRFRQRPMLAILLSLCALAIPLQSRHINFPEGIPWLEPYAVNIVSARGVIDSSPMLSERPVVLNVRFREALTFVCLFSTLLAAVVIKELVDTKVPRAMLAQWQINFVLSGPFAIAYCCLLVPRAAFSVPLDRYLIPLVVLASAFLGLLYQQGVQPRLPASAFVVGLLFTAFGFVAMHDLFAFERARVAAIDELRRAGIPRDSIGGGFEYDGWTQITKAKTMSDARIQNPKGITYYMPQGRNGTCHNNTEFLLSAVHPKFYLSMSPALCTSESSIPRVQFQPWLPRQPITIYILNADQ